LEIRIYKTKSALGASAAEHATHAIQSAIVEHGCANIVLATGTSQFDLLKHLVQSQGVDWEKVNLFHLDEYIGLGADHPASFRRYLTVRFVNMVGKLKNVYFIHGDAVEPELECKRISRIILEHPIDVALIGIGENGHIAFNDPPADFDTEQPYIIVILDETCRKQQVGEGWFTSIAEVPSRAISMSVRHVMRSKCIIVSVPDRRKAVAVRNALEGDVTPRCPASILQQHPNCVIFLDEAAASLLSGYSRK
jgi:glucosamine-6-phosphate deaminase